MTNFVLIRQTEEDMRNCFQFGSQSVYDHGISVSKYAIRLQQGEVSSMSLPQWFVKHGKELIAKIENWNKFLVYTTYHDCGKPYCRILDAKGKHHFPDHEKVSYEHWKLIEGDGYVAQCMLHDMDIHRIKGDGVAAFASLPEAPSLLVAGLSEIHANAEMFGGIESQGFKIKFAQIDRRGKAVCQILFGH